MEAGVARAARERPPSAAATPDARPRHRRSREMRCDLAHPTATLATNVRTGFHDASMEALSAGRLAAVIRSRTSIAGFVEAQTPDSNQATQSD